MKWTKADIDSICGQLSDEMAAMLDAAPDKYDPGKKGAEKPPQPWSPHFGPTQQAIMRDNADVLGVCGEKYTGKSYVCLHKIVAHCHTQHDALFTIIGNNHSALAEGVCHDMIADVLPIWRDGNRVPPFRWDGNVLVPNQNAGELIDQGVGLEFSPWKSDPNTKHLWLKIRNIFGGWSRIRVVAIPYAEMVQARVTNLNASGVYLEEATRCNGKEYYIWPQLQLYRRKGITGPQQFLFSCNPDDPDKEGKDSSKWVWRWMYKDSSVAKHEEGRDWPNDPEQPGIRRDKNISFYYLHYRENMANVSQKNREVLKRTLQSDPIKRQRLLESKWIPEPEGDALFKGHFQEGIHIKGDLEKHRGLEPIPGYPIVIGMDWGARSVGVPFQQIIESEDGSVSIAFDCISYYHEMHKTRQLARAVLEKMRYWNEWLRDKKQWDLETAPRDDRGNLKELPPSWCWWFITGDDATTNFNPDSGNIHARDFQDHMSAILEEEPDRYLGIETPVIRGCPRPKDSVGKRVDIMAEALMSEMAFVSAACEDVRGMLFHLPRDKDNPSHPAKGNRWIHIFDGWSYPNYYRRFFLPHGYYNIDEGSAIEVS